MKLFSVQSGQTKDNHAIQRRSSLLIFTAILPTGIDEDTQQEVQKSYQDFQKSILSSLESVIINLKLTGRKTTDLIKNFSATEIMKISQTLGFPVIVKMTATGLSVSFSIPLTLDRTSLPFSATNTLYLSVANNGANSIDVYAIDTFQTSESNILRYEREILQAGQRKDYINADDNYVTAVVETKHEVEAYHINGEVCQYLPDELDVLNDFNAVTQLVWNNENHSNFGNMSSIPMYGVRKVAIQGTENDENVFFVRNVNL
jgi:hypothetical protein